MRTTPNINVRVVGTANVTQMKSAFAQVQAQVAATNAQLASMVDLSKGVDVSGYQRLAAAAAKNDRAFRNAVASTGMFEQMQMRINKATDDYVDALNKQKLSFRDMAKQRKVAAAAYKEQLRMEQMVVRQSAQSNARGKQMLDVMYPKAVSAELDTAGKRLAFFNKQLASGANQMLNWGKNTQWAGRQLMVGLTMPIAAFGAAAGVMAYKVDQELTRIRKVYDSQTDAYSRNAETQIAYEKEMQAVREAGIQTAMDAAKRFGAAATDTLNVQAELAATGLQGAKLQESTNEVMRIAALGELEYADAIAATISMQSVFRMSTQELAEAFNYINAVENATSLQTKDFAAAIPIAAAPVKAFGGDIKELGILLTAMKERGIEATQGANAIKAAMQRLGRPSKQVQEEWKNLTNTDITKLFDDSTSLIDLFQRISDATADLSSKDKIKAFSGLFGTYQVTRMSALVEGMQDLRAGVGQVSEAARQAEEDAAAQARKAAKEEKDRIESISGQWDSALETMKLALTQFGEPFLQIATKVVNAITWILNTFNELPHGIKVLAGIGITLAALAGPAIMLVGLFANLTANALKGVSSLTNLAVRMEILSSDSRAQRIATDLVSAGFVSQTSAAQQLSAALEKLAMSERVAYGAMLPQVTVPAGNVGRFTPSPSGLVQPLGGIPISDPDAAKKEAAAKKRTMGYMAMGAVSAAAMATSMGITMFSSNETAGHIAKWLMIGSIVVPAVAMMWPLAQQFATWVGAGAAGLAKSAVNSYRTAGGLAAAATAARGLGAALNAAMGPAGWIALALTAAVGGVLYLQKIENDREQKNEEIAKKQLEAQKALNNAAEYWAETVGRTARNYGQFVNQVAGTSPASPTEMKENVDIWKEETPNETTGKNTVETYKELADDIEKANYEVQIFSNLQAEAGLSAKKAMSVYQSFLIAAGYSFEEAAMKARMMFDEWGDFSGLRKSLNSFRTAVDYAMQGTSADMKVRGEAAGQEWVRALGAAAGPKEVERVIGRLTGVISDKWQEVYDELSSTETGQMMLAEFDVRNAEEFFMFVKQQGKDIVNMFPDDAFFETSMGDIITEEEMESMNSLVKSAYDLEAGLIDGASAGLMLGTEIESLDQLLTSTRVKSYTSSYKDLRAEAIRLNEALKFTQQGVRHGQIDPMEAREQETLALIQMQLFAASKGIKQSRDYATQLDYILRNVKITTDSVTRSAQGLSRAFSVSAPEALDIRRSAMESVQQEIADDTMESFENQMESALESRQDMWDRRVDEQSKAFDRQQKALDTKWENKRDKAEEYWDARVERIQDAIEAEEKAEAKRQRMFDNEMSRIKRLNDAMNKNIDFNIALNEGNLDEAARIRNDQMADAVQQAYEGASNRSGRRSGRRTDRLEGRLENIEEAREVYMERLDKREQDEREHLQKIQEIRQKALQREVENDMEAQQDMWEARKEHLQDGLDLFLSYIAVNKRDLQRHIREVGAEYDSFGKNTLMPMGEDWSRHFGERMRYHIRKAGRELQTDQIWARLGKKSAVEIVKGMGFSGMGEFKHFIKTGEMGGGKNKVDPDFIGPVQGDRHTGGWVNEGRGSRKGVARTLKGLHSSERLMRTREGEFIVNEDAAQKNAGVLEHMNKTGRLPSVLDVSPQEDGKGAGPGIAGLISAMTARGLVQGAAQAMNRAYAKKMAQSVGSFSIAKAGLYGDTHFDREQLKNAAIIADVGGQMNMSKRDITIALMTAMQESMLRNLKYGDRDSQGLFQQRPSQGWGTVAQVTDPYYASRKFFEGLKGIEDRDDMAMWAAAQAVQRSAYPMAYAKWQDEAQAIMAAMNQAAGFGGIFPTGNANRLGAQAINWAADRIGDSGWQALCQKFVRMAFGAPSGYASAISAWHGARLKHGGDWTPPPGVPVYWSGGTYGHAALHTGGGRIISTDYPTMGRIGTGTIQGLTRDWGKTYLGWAGDINGKQVYPVPGMKVGGTVNHDNTIANLHKGERVLTAPLTKKLDVAIDALYRAARASDGGAKPYGKFKYPGMGSGASDYPYTWFSANNLKGGGSTPIANTKGGQVRSGAYNVSWRSSDAGFWNAFQRMRDRADVLSLNEVYAGKQNVLRKMEEAGWGNHGKSDSWVVWNKRKYDFLKGGTQVMNPNTHGKGPSRKRNAAYAQLRDRESGFKFWQIAAHTQPWPHKSPLNARIQREQFNTLGNLYKRLSGSAPTILAGDLNESTQGVAGQFGGLRSIWQNNMGGIGTHGKGNWIDHVMYDPRVMKLLGASILGGLSSDHNAIFSRFNIPAMAKGGHIKWDNTLANLHKGETVLTADLSKQLRDSVGNFANGASVVYDIDIDARGLDINEDQLADKVVKKIERENGRKPGSRSNR